MKSHVIMVFVAAVVTACGGNASSGGARGDDPSATADTTADGATDTTADTATDTTADNAADTTANKPVDVTLPIGNSFKLSFIVLGAPKRSNDECSWYSHSFTVALGAGQAAYAECVGAENEDRVLKTTTKSLSASEVNSLKSELSALRVTDRPEPCGYDGPSYGLETAGQTFIDYDYNCMHRSDVEYVTKLNQLDSALKKVFDVQ